MSIGLLFWILMLIWLIFGLWWNYPAGGDGTPAGRFGPIGGHILAFILLFLLGWRVFGFIIQN